MAEFTSKEDAFRKWWAKTGKPANVRIAQRGFSVEEQIELAASWACDFGFVLGQANPSIPDAVLDYNYHRSGLDHAHT